MTLRAAIASLLLLALVTTLACTTSQPTQEALKAEVVSALDALAAELAASRPTDVAAYAERLHAYLDAPRCVLRQCCGTAGSGRQGDWAVTQFEMGYQRIR